MRLLELEAVVALEVGGATEAAAALLPPAPLLAGGRGGVKVV